MQSVGDRWYIRYNIGASVLAVFLILLAAAAWFMPVLRPVESHWQVLSGVTIFIASVQLLYSGLVWRKLVDSIGYYQATAVISFMQALNILNLVHSTGKLHSWFLVPWAIIILASGIFGIVGMMCCVFLSGLLYFFDISEVGGLDTMTDPISLVSMGSIIAVCFLAYFVWRRQYVHEESDALAQLSGKLKTNEKQAEILVQSLTDGVLLLNTEGQINLMNPAAALMTGWTIEEGTGTDFRLVINLHKEDGSDLVDTENPLVRIFATKAPSTETLQLMSRQDKPIVVSLVTSPIIDARTGNLSGVIAVLRDVSVARQEEKQRAEFISTASHEMRTPVAAIEGYLALAMNEKVSTIDTKARSYLQKAHESTQHLGKLFQDLLMSAKAEDGRLVSHPKVVEMGAYVEQLAESFRFSADKKGLLTDFVFGASSSTGTGSTAGEHTVRPLYYVYVDEDRLREVITNLFDNAVKYTPTGKISVGLTGNADVIQIYIRDTGPGIPAEDLPHLFQKFYRVDNSATRTIGGTGLGLFICRKIVELYQGRIWVESTVGKGSTFYINLPRLSSQKATELQSKEAQNVAPDPVTSLTTPV